MRPRIAAPLTLVPLLAVSIAPAPVGAAGASASAASAPAAPRGGLPARNDVSARGGLTSAGRYIVVLKAGNPSSVVAARHERFGVKVDAHFRTIGGYAARLTPSEKARIAADPSVAAVVPDEIVEKAQTTPTGVSRVNATRSPVAAINGSDTRVNADVAIVDTGISPTHPDLNVAGGYNCSTGNRGLWRDVDGHGTHVAGTVAAIDNGGGVVGVAPGARLWAVKILNDEGFGYLSWYVCGLDWIAAQRDPADPTRPRFEAVNMSVAKSGRDDGACGSRNNDILHAAICRLVSRGVTVVAAAANDSSTASARVPAAYDEVITVSALADTDGKAGGLGGQRCFSWGGYDRDDTFADFSNYGWDVDLIAPGKCIWSSLPGNKYGYSSGTSMAAPHVTGAVALYKASRPRATPAEVKAALQYLGSTRWFTSTDPDPYHERLLDVSRVGSLGDFSVGVSAPSASVGERGGTATMAIRLSRSSTFFERVTLTASVPAGWGRRLAASSLFGWSGNSTSVAVTVPAGTAAGRYAVTVRGSNWGRVRSATTTVVVTSDAPTARAPVLKALTGIRFGDTLRTRASWSPATDPSSSIGGYEAQWSVDGGGWGSTASMGAGSRTASRSIAAGHTYGVRDRARDVYRNWSSWAATTGYQMAITQDTSSAVKPSASWRRYRSSSMSGGTSLYSSSKGAAIAFTFTGRSVALVMPKGPTRGSAAISIDGRHVTTISTYRSSPIGRIVLFSRAWPTTQTHRIVITVVGTAGHPRVDLDAIIVLK